MTIVFLIICWMLSVDDHLCVMIAVLKQVKQSACLCLCLCLFIFIRSHYLNPEVLCTRSESVSSARPHRDNKIPVATVPLSLSNPALWLAVGVRDWDRERREKERGIMFPLLAKGSVWLRLSWQSGFDLSTYSSHLFSDSHHPFVSFLSASSISPAKLQCNITNVQIGCQYWYQWLPCVKGPKCAVH